MKITLFEQLPQAVLPVNLVFNIRFDFQSGGEAVFAQLFCINGLRQGAGETTPLKRNGNLVLPRTSPHLQIQFQLLARAAPQFERAVRNHALPQRFGRKKLCKWCL